MEKLREQSMRHAEFLREIDQLGFMLTENASRYFIRSNGKVNWVALEIIKDEKFTIISDHAFLSGSEYLKQELFNVVSRYFKSLKGE